MLVWAFVYKHCNDVFSSLGEFCKRPHTPVALGELLLDASAKARIVSQILIRKHVSAE